MLNFGMIKTFGGSSGKSCPRPSGEIFYNRHFDCGLDYWELDPNYGGSVIDNGDSTVTLTATEQWSSLTQSKQFPIPAGDYHMKVIATSISGKGKMSYKLQNGTWHNAFAFDVAGTYEADVTVTQPIVMFDIGADDDPSAVITFDLISCTTSVNVVFGADNVVFGSDNVTFI